MKYIPNRMQEQFRFYSFTFEKKKLKKKIGNVLCVYSFRDSFTIIITQRKLTYSETTKIVGEIITGRNEVLAKVIFLHLSVILFTGGSGKETPRLDGGTPPPPSWMEEPLPRLDGEPPPAGWRNPPRMENPPPRSTIGRYASYWNAFLFYIILHFTFN